MKRKRKSEDANGGEYRAGKTLEVAREENGGMQKRVVVMQKQQLKQQEERRRKLTRMHRASFCEYKPRGVVSLAVHAWRGNGTPLFYVAVAREGGEIEMWLTERDSAAAAAAAAATTTTTAAGGDTDAEKDNDRQKGKRRYKIRKPLQNGALPTREKLSSTVVDRHWTKDGADISSVAFISDGNDEDASNSDDDSVTLVAGTLSGELYAWKEDNRCGRKNMAVIDAGGGAIWGLAVTSDENFLRSQREERRTNQPSNANGVLLENGNGDHHNDGSDDDDDKDNNIENNNARDKELNGNGMRTHTFDDEEHHRSLIAVACDDGGVRVFACCHAANGNVAGGKHAASTNSLSTEPRLVRALPKVKGKTLCCEWLPKTRSSDTDDAVACIAFGSSEGIVHIWDYHNGVEVNRITIGGGSAAGVSGDKGNAACVWSIAAIHAATTTANVVIAVGTSDGVTSFWDTRFGTMLASFRKHEAAVVSVVVEGKNVFSTGVDNRVCMFTLVTEDGGALDERADAPGNDDDGRTNRTVAITNGNAMPTGVEEKIAKWMYLGYQRPHSHQVRSLALAGSGRGSTGSSSAPPALFSGGAEGCVCVSAPNSFLREHPRVMCSMPTPPSLAVVEGPSRRNDRNFGGGELLLCQQQNSLDLWQLGFSRVDSASFEAQDERDVEGAPVDLAAAPSHLARVRSSSPSRAMLSSAISRDGATIAYSDSERCCVLRVEYHSAVGTAGGDGESMPDTLKIKSLSKDTSLPTIPASRCLSLPPSRHESQLLLAMMNDGAVWVIDLQERELMHVFSGFLGRYSFNMSDGLSCGLALPETAKEVTGDGAGGDDEDDDAVAVNFLLPCPSTTAVSPDGQWLAVASLPRVSVRPSSSSPYVDEATTTAHATRDGDDADGVRIAVLSLEGLITHTLIRVSNCLAVTSMAFTHAGDVLAVATLAHDVLFFSVESGQLCRHFSGIPTGVLSTAAAPSAGTMKQKMRSVIKGICFSPTPGSVSALMFTDESIMYKNFLMPAATKRVHHVASGSEMIPAGAASTNVAHERVLPLEHPCLFVQYLSGDDALLVERPWASALLSLPAGSLPARTRTFAQ